MIRGLILGCILVVLGVVLALTTTASMNGQHLAGVSLAICGGATVLRVLYVAGRVE